MTQKRKQDFKALAANVMTGRSETKLMMICLGKQTHHSKVLSSPCLLRPLTSELSRSLRITTVCALFFECFIA